MADPTVSNTWSSGEVLTAADLNENFADIIAFFAAGSITKSHITHKYTDFCITMCKSNAIASGSSVQLELDTAVNLIPVKLTLHTDNILGGTLSVEVRKEPNDAGGVSIMDGGSLTTTNDIVQSTSAFLGGEIAAGTTLQFNLTHSTSDSSADITVCLWCKAELRA